MCFFIYLITSFLQRPARDFCHLWLFVSVLLITSRDRASQTVSFVHWIDTNLDHFVHWHNTLFYVIRVVILMASTFFLATWCMWFCLLYFHIFFFFRARNVLLHNTLHGMKSCIFYHCESAGSVCIRWLLSCYSCLQSLEMNFIQT